MIIGTELRVSSDQACTIKVENGMVRHFVGIIWAIIQNTVNRPCTCISSRYSLWVPGIGNVVVLWYITNDIIIVAVEGVSDETVLS